MVCGLAIWGDRRAGGRSAFGYWVAIVVLRAAATNVADFMTERLALGFVAVGAGLVVLAVLAGSRTTPLRMGVQAASPLIDGWYWTAMFVGGVFGTVAGDLASRVVGVLPAAAVLTAVLLAVLAVRGRWAPGAMLGYWAAVLAERSAGTPIGDGLANRHGFGLGLGLATCITASLFGLALGWWAWTRRGAVGTGAERDGAPPGRS